MFFRVFKRIFDIVSASLLLLIISPLFLLLIILVKYNIGSPVFFTQERTGMYQKRFNLIKFRTMTNEKDENGNLLSYAETLKSLIERERICSEERNVMVSHQFYLPTGTDAEKVERMDSEIRTIGNIDQVSAEVLEAFDYSALGHIHKPMKVGSDRIRYCGTPLAVSVSEADQRKSVLCVEIKEKGKKKNNI